MRRTIPILIAVAVVLTGCASVDSHPKTLPGASERAFGTVAVVPVAVTFAGKAPRDLDADRLIALEEAESLAFQHGLFDALVERAGGRRRPPVELVLQPVEVTNDRLRERGISIRDSWELESGELARALEVDAIVRSEVYRWRHRSNWASFGWEIGQEILHDATHDGDWDDHDHGVVPVKTHDIVVDTALVDGHDGEVVWGIQVETAINWLRRPNGVVRGVSRQVARDFPRI